MRAFALVRSLRPKCPRRPAPNWPRSPAWQTARKHHIAANPFCARADGTCSGPREAHDFLPYSRLSDLERGSYAYLRQNFVTLCRRHHRQLHFHSGHPVAHASA